MKTWFITGASRGCAFLGSADIAQKKARTAALFGYPTEALYDFVKPGGTSPGFDRTNGGLIVFAGGMPVRGGDGQLLGAVAVHCRHRTENG